MKKVYFNLIEGGVKTKWISTISDCHTDKIGTLPFKFTSDGACRVFGRGPNEKIWACFGRGQKSQFPCESV